MLRGRAYERESVPYKAVDSAIDALSRHLCGSTRAAQPLAPPGRHPRARRVSSPSCSAFRAWAAPRHEASDNPQGMRRRAFVALRDLLSSLAERQPLVVFVDDAQWGDVDSVALLAELTRPPERAAAASRDDVSRPGGGDEPLLERDARDLAGVRRRPRHRGRAARRPAMRTRMALSRARGLRRVGAGERRAAVVRESSGSPLLVEELVRSHRSDAARRAPTLGDRHARPDGRRAARPAPRGGAPARRGGRRRGPAAAVSTFAAASGHRRGRRRVVALLRGAALRADRASATAARSSSRSTTGSARRSWPAPRRRPPRAPRPSGLRARRDARRRSRGARAAHARRRREASAARAAPSEPAEEAASKLAFDQAARLFRLALDTSSDRRRRDGGAARCACASPRCSSAPVARATPRTRTARQPRGRRRSTESSSRRPRPSSSSSAGESTRGRSRCAGCSPRWG